MVRWVLCLTCVLIGLLSPMRSVRGLLVRTPAVPWFSIMFLLVIRVWSLCMAPLILVMLSGLENILVLVDVVSWFSAVRICDINDLLL